MAEEKKSEGGKKAKKHLHQIVTTRAHDGSYIHEHVYKAKKHDHHSEPPVFAGTSQGMEDLHQHMDDHFGGGAGEEQAEGAQGDNAGEEAAEGAQGAQQQQQPAE